MNIEIDRVVLTHKLEKIRKVFDIDAISNLKIDQRYINEYYRANKTAYDRYQFGTGLVHCGLSDGLTFKKEDLLGLTRLIEGYIERCNPHVVLELAAGRGGNGVYLARRFPHVEFVGIDTSDTQLVYANAQVNVFQNLHIFKYDFHNLKRFSDEQFDLVFVIEALCHSDDKDRVLQEVRRVLKLNGIFIVIDGYTHQNEGQLSNEETIAMKLLARGVAVQNFEQYDHFCEMVSYRGFEVIEEKDISLKILPFMKWHERRASWFFKFAPLARIIKKCLPDFFTCNALTGYLGPWLIEHQRYLHMVTVLKKV